MGYDKEKRYHLGDIFFWASIVQNSNCLHKIL